MQGFRVCGLTMNTEGTAVGLARTEDKFVDRNTRHYWKTQISSPCALCSNSFYIGYRRSENFIKSFIMDIRRAIYATHSVRGLSHTKVPSAEVGQVGPQDFPDFFAPERPLPSSPVMDRCGFGSLCRWRICSTLTSHWTCRSRSGLFAGLLRHPFCLKLYQVKFCKWLVGTQS